MEWSNNSLDFAQSKRNPHFILWFVWSWSLLQFIFSFAPSSNIAHSDVSARSRFTRTGNDDIDTGYIVGNTGNILVILHVEQAAMKFHQ